MTERSAERLHQLAAMAREYADKEETFRRCRRASLLSVRTAEALEQAEIALELLLNEVTDMVHATPAAFALAMTNAANMEATNA